MKSDFRCPPIARNSLARQIALSGQKQPASAIETSMSVMAQKAPSAARSFDYLQTPRNLFRRAVCIFFLIYGRTD